MLRKTPQKVRQSEACRQLILLSSLFFYVEFGNQNIHGRKPDDEPRHHYDNDSIPLF